MWSVVFCGALLACGSSTTGGGQGGAGQGLQGGEGGSAGATSAGGEGGGGGDVGIDPFATLPGVQADLPLLVADLDGDGADDISIVATRYQTEVLPGSRELHVLPAAGGSWVGWVGSSLPVDLLAGSLSGATLPELVLTGVGADWSPTSLLFREQQSAGVLDGYLTLALGDLDPGGPLEVVALSEADEAVTLHVLDGAGAELWSLLLGATAPSGCALGDVDGDGALDIVLALPGQGLRVLAAAGAELTGWPVALTDEPLRNVAVGDLDGDGTMEVLVGDATGSLHVHEHDGTGRFGWPRAVGSLPWSETPAADLDGDGELEVIVAATDGNVHLFRSDGTEVTDGWPVLGTVQPVESARSLVVGDVDGDLSPDVIFADPPSWVRAYHADGTPVAGFPLRVGEPSPTGVALGDFDGDARVELAVVATEHGGSLAEIYTAIYVVDFDATIAAGSLAWPQRAHDGQRTASFAP